MLTCDLLSILSQAGILISICGQVGQNNCQTTIDWTVRSIMDCASPESDCANHATLMRPLAVLDSDPGHVIMSNMFRCTEGLP